MPVVSAPAKVNLFLRVMGRRKDGYHSIETLFHTVGLFDKIRLSPAPRLRLVTTGLPSPRGRGNLCIRAAELLRKYGGFHGGARIHLTKRIPAGAGLGGGSSDAAACLIGLNKLWKLGLGRAELVRLGARLGADVPFFLLGGCAVGRGRGERLTPAMSRLRAWAVILKPRFPVRTREAYRALDRITRRARPAPGQTLQGTLNAVRRGSLRQFGVHNDFEQVVIRRHPKIGLLIRELRECGAAPAFMTGSGSAVVGIFHGRPPAQRTARLLGRRLHVLAVCAQLHPLRNIARPSRPDSV